jgi:hypothetical protein
LVRGVRREVAGGYRWLTPDGELFHRLLRSWLSAHHRSCLCASTLLRW